MSEVSSDEFTERVILCLPKFGWRVARAFLSIQGQWRSTYATGYNIDGYTVPNEAEFDKIMASIDETLAEDDMSCDLREGLDNIAEKIAQLTLTTEAVSSACCTSVSGSAGAGSSVAPPVDFEDDGVIYPDGFTSRIEYDNYKCAIAHYITEAIITDIKYLRETEVTAIVASVLVVTLLTPVPGDEVIALVGSLALMAIEATLDLILDEIIDGLEEDQEEIECMIYNSLSASALYNELQIWIEAKFSATATWIASKFFGMDILNWAFEKVQKLIPMGGVDCSTCPALEYYNILFNLGVIDYQSEDGEDLELTATFGHAGNNEDHWWIIANLQSYESGPFEIVSITTDGWTDHGDWPEYAVSGYYNQQNTWVPYATIQELVGAVIYPNRSFHFLGGQEFSVTVELQPYT